MRWDLPSALLLPAVPCAAAVVVVAAAVLHAFQAVAGDVVDLVDGMTFHTHPDHRGRAS